MKSAMKRSLAMLLTVLMVLSVCALSLQMVVLAATTDNILDGNTPCNCGNAAAHKPGKTEAPTCSEWGYTWYKCDDTAKEWAWDFVKPDATKHNFVEGEPKEPTCTEPGFTGKVCEHCGKEGEGVSTPALGHDLYIVIDVEGDKVEFDLESYVPDCVTSQEVIVGCSREGCTAFGENGIATTLPAQGHEHQLVLSTDKDAVQAPTCTEKGYITYECVRCEEDTKFKVEFAPLGHTYNTEEYNEGCEFPTYKPGAVCVRPNVDNLGQVVEGICGHEHENAVVGTDIIPAIHHEWEKIEGDDMVLEATCDKDGYQWWECTNKGCDETKKETFDKFDCFKKEIEELIEANKVGSAEYLEYREIIETVDPVCSVEGYSNGYRLEKCKECGKEHKIYTVPAEHDYKIDAGANIRYTFAEAMFNEYGDKIVKLNDDKATYYKVATEKCDAGSSCKGCDKCVVFASPVADLPDDLDPDEWIAIVWVVQETPTYDEPGILVHSCKICQFAEALHTTSIHVKGDVKGTVAATCIERSYTIYECADCGMEFNVYNMEEDAPKGHFWKDEANPDGYYLGFDKDGKPVVNKLPAKAPTCTEWGNAEAEYCYNEDCDLYKDYDPTPTEKPLGHVFDCAEWIKATGSDIKVEDCKDCDLYVEPTCARWGYTVKHAKCHREGCEGVNPARTEEELSYDTAVKNGLVDTKTPKPEHVFDLENFFTPGYDATCSTEGRYPVVMCEVCGILHPDEKYNGTYIEKLPHSGTTYTYVGTCQYPSMTVTFCENCAPWVLDAKDNKMPASFDPAAYHKAADKAAYLASLDVYHAMTVELNGVKPENDGHQILGAVMGEPITLKDGTIIHRWDVSGATVIYPGVTDLDGDGTPDYDAVTYPGQYREGSCGYDDGKDHETNYHNAYYICAHCYKLIEFSVIKDHTTVDDNGTLNSAEVCEPGKLCTVCGDMVEEPKAHKWEDDENGTVLPTCTSQGYTHQTCSVCDAKRIGKRVSALGHYYDYEGGTVETKATCTADGFITYTCGRADCEYVEVKATEEKALGHDFSVAPDCIHAQGCSRCDAEDPTIAPALGHVWERAVDGKPIDKDLHFYQEIRKVVITFDDKTGEIKVVVTAENPDMSRDANCTEFGYEVYECAECGFVFGDNFEAAHGHDYDRNNDGKVDASDLVVNGDPCKDTVIVKYYQCETEGCGHIDEASKQTSSALGYHMNATGEEIMLNCVWLMTHSEEDCTCVTCGQLIDAYPYHDDLNKVPAKNPTCTEYGVILEYCGTCGYKHILNGEDDILEPYNPNHDFDEEHLAHFELYKTDAPTVTSDGANYYRCKYCGLESDKFIETIPALKGLVVSADTANGWVADAKIVNNGILAYTIYIEGLNTKFFSLNVDVTYNNKHFTYIGFNLGDDGKNIFGDMNFNFGTEVGAGKVDGDYTTLGFYGLNENTADGQKTNVTLGKDGVDTKQEYITVYFRVNGDVHTNNDPKAAVVVPSTITLGNIVCLTAEDDPDTTEDDVYTQIDDAEEIEIHKLGNLSGEGLVGPEDLAAIRECFLACVVDEKAYDARADINVDGRITMEDLRLLTQVKVYSLGYDKLAELVEAFEVK